MHGEEKGRYTYAFNHALPQTKLRSTNACLFKFFYLSMNFMHVVDMSYLLSGEEHCLSPWAVGACGSAVNGLDRSPLHLAVQPVIPPTCQKHIIFLETSHWTGSKK